MNFKGTNEGVSFYIVPPPGLGENFKNIKHLGTSQTTRTMKI